MLTYRFSVALFSYHFFDNFEALFDIRVTLNEEEAKESGTRAMLMVDKMVLPAALSCPGNSRISLSRDL